MKILLAIGSSQIGGGQIVFHSCLREFLNKGCHVIVALPEGPLVELIKSYNIKIHIINFDSLNSLLKIVHIMKLEQVDIINTYLTRCSLLFSFINLFYRFPLCCTLLNEITHVKLNKIQRHIYPYLYYLLHKLSDGIIVNSEQNKKHFIETAKMDGGSIAVIYSGINDDFYSISQVRSNNNELILGAVGRLSPEKGIYYLIEALTLLQGIDYKCLIVGEGILRDELEEYVRLNNLQDKVVFTGFQNDVIPFMQQMDIVIVPSLSETFGISIVEAFALRKLVIASNVGGIPELVKQNITGLLFPVKDSIALAKAIEYSFKNRSKTELISNNAYAFAKANFTSEIMAKNTLSYYEQLINRKTAAV